MSIKGLFFMLISGRGWRRATKRQKSDHANFDAASEFANHAKGRIWFFTGGLDPSQWHWSFRISRKIFFQDFQSVHMKIYDFFSDLYQWSATSKSQKCFPNKSAASQFEFKSWIWTEYSFDWLPWHNRVHFRCCFIFTQNGVETTPSTTQENIKTNNFAV